MAFAVPALAAVGTAFGASAGTAAAVGATVISTAVSVVGAGVSAYSQHSQAKTQQALLRRNASISDENAVRARERAQVEQQDQDLVAKAVLGELAASQAASGLSFGSGSFASRRKSAEVLARKDALNIRQAGELEAYSSLQEGADYRFEAGQAGKAGRLSLLEGFLSGTSSIISGASQVNRIRAGRITRDAAKVRAGLLT